MMNQELLNRFYTDADKINNTCKDSKGKRFIICFVQQLKNKQKTTSNLQENCLV